MKSSDLIAFFGSRFRIGQTAAEALHELKGIPNELRKTLVDIAWSRTGKFLSELYASEFSKILQGCPEEIGAAPKAKPEIPVNNAPQAALFAMGMQRHDEIIPGRGGPYVDPTTGFTHVRFTRPGVEGEFHLVFKVDHTPPFKAQEQK